jgi:SAM-dependent methyltransferase
MRGETYYFDDDFIDFLDSRRRKKLFNLSLITDPLKGLFQKSKHILDFGCGTGNFPFTIVDNLHNDNSIFACECQERMIDIILKKKVELGIRIDAITPFYAAKTDRPIFPGWLPKFDLIWTQECLCTFPNPTLALDSFREILKRDGYIVIIDWEKIESPIGPEESQKVSKERMEYFIKEAFFDIKKEFIIGDYHYAYLCQLNPDIPDEEFNVVQVAAQQKLTDE